MEITMVALFIGWIITIFLTIRGWRKNIELLEKNTENQLMYEGRQKVIESLENYRNWLADLYNTTLMIENKDIYFKSDIMVNQKNLVNRISSLFKDYSNSYDWNRQLRIYREIFPSTKKIRIQLDKIHDEIGKELDNYERKVSKFIIQNDPTKLVLKENQFKKKTTILNQGKYILELLDYLETYSIKQLLPSKKPELPKLKSLQINDDGDIEIIEKN